LKKHAVIKNKITMAIRSHVRKYYEVGIHWLHQHLLFLILHWDLFYNMGIIIKINVLESLHGGSVPCVWKVTGSNPSLAAT